MSQKSFFSKVRGISIDGRWRHVLGCRHGEILYYCRDKKNRADPNAIALFRKKGWLFKHLRHIGFLSSELAEQFAPLLDQGGDLKIVAEEITGRGSRIGLNIHITYNPQQKAKAAARLRKYGPEGAIKRSREDPL